MSAGVAQIQGGVTKLTPAIGVGKANPQIKQNFNQKAFMASMLAAQDVAKKIKQYSQAIDAKYGNLTSLQYGLKAIEKLNFESWNEHSGFSIDMPPTGVDKFFYDFLMSKGVPPAYSGDGKHEYRNRQIKPIFRAAIPNMKTAITNEIKKLEKDEQIAEERVMLKEQVKKYDLILGVAAKIQKILHDAAQKILSSGSFT